MHLRGHPLLVLSLTALSIFPASQARAQPPPPPLATPGVARPPFVDRTSLFLLTAFGGAAIAGKVFENDSFMTRALDNPGLEGIYGTGNVYGQGVWLSVAALGTLGAGFALHDPRLTSLGGDLGTSLLATWGVVWALKLTVPSTRPNGGKYSFPSGHTATAFAAAPVLAAHLGRGAGALAYGLAGVTALARMEDGKHHLADVLAGAGIGLVVGHEVTRRGPLHWTVAPNGLALSLRF